MTFSFDCLFWRSWFPPSLSLGFYLAAQVVRSCGSSIVWVYSTLLIQLRVPNELQGRMMALEMALYVVRSRCNWRWVNRTGDSAKWRWVKCTEYLQHVLYTVEKELTCSMGTTPTACMLLLRCAVHPPRVVARQGCTSQLRGHHHV